MLFIRRRLIETLELLAEAIRGSAEAQSDLNRTQARMNQVILRQLSEHYLRIDSLQRRVAELEGQPAGEVMN